jgi:hypothetical protein
MPGLAAEGASTIDVPGWPAGPTVVLGGMPTSSAKRVPKAPSDEHPTAKHTSVTLRSPPRSRAMAGSMRRVMT